MSLNHERCHLFTITSDLPIYLLDFPHFPFLRDFCQAKHDPHLPKELRLDPKPHADYLGVVLTHNASAKADAKKRCQSTVASP